MKYITTPIYYVNDVPHIGHAYTTILSDIFKKYQILRGREAYLLTGTDEHGQKIENSAKLQNKEPKQYADEISAKFQSMWDYMDIDYDYFVRTTNKNHIQEVQKAFKIMFDRGDIYKGKYEGYYCISCETFFTKRQLVNTDKCPDCGKITNFIEEDSYFFALRKYDKKLINWYENNDVIIPTNKKNEILRFIENGLNDISITRNSFKWGIALPQVIKDNDEHVIYVWLDALLSYRSQLQGNKLKYMKDMTHFVGKDILRFHAIYWPAFLMSLNLPLPKKIYAHGWWTIDGVKMSKSIGNVINPRDIVEEYGIEATRYFLARESTFGKDGDFNHKALINRINSDLSDSLGNLLNRFISMSEKYFLLNLRAKNLFAFKKEIDSINCIIGELEPYIENMMLNKYLEEIWKIFDIANGAITSYAPWELIKNNENTKAQELLVLIANILSKGALLIYPILPQTSQKIMNAVGIKMSDYSRLITMGDFINEFKIKKVSQLFPKIIKEEDHYPKENNQKEENQINIKQFEKLDIRVGKVIEASIIENSDKLLKLQIDFGDEIGKRQIISGIRAYYSCEEIKNKLVCAILNLKPIKILGEESNGMILSVKNQNNDLSLISPISNVNLGSKIV